MVNYTRVPASGPKNAKIMAIGMAPEKNEVNQMRPFVGWSGQTFDAALKLNGVDRESVYATNVSEVPLYEFGGKATTRLDQLPKNFIMAELERLKKEIYEVKPNIIICMGDEPSEFVAGKSGITKWRGSVVGSSLVPGYKCLLTVHPAWIQRGMWRWNTIFQRVDIARAIGESETPKLTIPRFTEHLAPTVSRIREFCDTAKGHPWTTFDIETIAWSKNKPGHIACFGIGFSKDEALCIPFVRNKNGQPYYTIEEELTIWRALAELMESDTQKVGQNFSFDWLYCWLYGVYPRNAFIDTMLLHHCLYPDFGGAEEFFGRKGKRLDKPGHSLAFISSCYTTHPYYKDDGKFWESGNIEELWSYNCKDVCITHWSASQMMKEAVADGMWQYFQETYMDPFIGTLISEWDGIEQDVALRAVADKETTAAITEQQEMLDKDLGYKLNVASPPQVQQLLYSKKGFGYPIVFNRKSRKPTADKFVIEKYAIKYQNPVLQRIIAIRKLKDFQSDILRQRLDDRNRIHTHWKIGGTNGARWSSARGIFGSGTNLQNQPRKGIARRLFIAS